jgi:hypothetical protein
MNSLLRELHLFPHLIPQGKVCSGRETTLLKLGHPIWYLPICLSVCLWDQQPPASSAPHQPLPQPQPQPQPQPAVIPACYKC